MMRRTAFPARAFRPLATLFTLGVLMSAGGCRKGTRTSGVGDRVEFTGAWRSRIVFRSGALATVKDLEFLCTYNLGGTMTESSNYDEAANSSPPAYGIWKQVAPHTYQTKYVFYTTRDAAPGEGPPNRDWWPAGHGVLTENVTLSADGLSYTSTISLDMFDRSDKPMTVGGEGTGAGTRIVF